MKEGLVKEILKAYEALKFLLSMGNYYQMPRNTDEFQALSERYIVQADYVRRHAPYFGAKGFRNIIPQQIKGTKRTGEQRLKDETEQFRPKNIPRGTVEMNIDRGTSSSTEYGDDGQIGRDPKRDNKMLE